MIVREKESIEYLKECFKGIDKLGEVAPESQIRRDDMKTVLIFDQLLQEPSLSFLVVDGDYSHLHYSYINSSDCSEENQDTIISLVYTPEWCLVEGFTTDFPTQAVVEGAKVVVIGFLL